MNRFSSYLRLTTILGILVGLAIPISSPTSADPVPPKTITLTPVGNNMEFAETEFSVRPGQRVTIVFENTATSPAMVHNVVVLNTSDEEVVKRIGQAAVSASNYVPDDPTVIAATDVAEPGEATEVTFTAPEAPGEYTYVCTYPGHYVSMYGTMVVKE